MNPQMSGQYILYFLLAFVGHVCLCWGTGNPSGGFSQKQSTGKSLSLSKLPLFSGYLPYIRPYKAYVKGYPHKIYQNMALLIWYQYSTSMLGSWNSHWTMDILPHVTMLGQAHWNSTAGTCSSKIRTTTTCGRARDASKNLSIIYNHLQVEYEIASKIPCHFISWRVLEISISGKTILSKS
jgi:hypothetical protein